MATTRSSARLRQKKVEIFTDPPTIAPKASTSKASRAPRAPKPPPKASKAPANARGKTTQRKKQKVNGSVAEVDGKPDVAWAKVKGKRGHLKMVVEMPFDILLEIFKYLQPVALLSLLGASRSTRALLLDRSVSFQVWKHSFSIADPAPPPCPDDITFPQYANLLYGRSCYFCSSIHGLERSFTCYVRFCSKCFDEQFIAVKNTDPFYGDMRAIAPQPSGRHRARIFLRTDYERHSKELKRLQDLESEYNEYVKREKAKTAARMRRALVEFSHWDRVQANAKRNDIEIRRGERYGAILGKLRELGYEKELQRLNYTGTMMLPGIGGVRPVTQREWEKVKPNLVSVLDELRRGHARDERRKLIRSRTQDLSKVLECYISRHREDEPFAPRTCELAKLGPFRTLIYDTPENEKVSYLDFLKLEETVLPQIIKTWKEDTVGVLLDLMPQASAKKKGKGSKLKGKAKAPPFNLDLVHRATTIFSCKRCHDLLVYPNIMWHNCFLVPQGYNDVEEPDDVDPNYSWMESIDQIEFSELASEYATEIIKVLGKDPNTVTCEELDEPNKRLQCVRCSGPKRLVMNWRHAILHEIARHTDEEEDSDCSDGWALLDRASLAAAYTKETQSQKKPNPWRFRNVKHCVKCDICTLGSNGLLIKSSLGQSRVTGDGLRCETGSHVPPMGVYDFAYRAPFKIQPYQVKI